MQLFYHPDIRPLSMLVTFSKEESRHLVKVLRKKRGDQIQITDGRGNLYLAEIISDNDKKCEVQVLNSEAKPDQKGYRLHIAIAPTKNNDRLEWFLEKSTEIGIDEITPILCDHSERKKINHERCEKVILAVGNVEGVAEVEADTSGDPVFHTVEKGDTLWAIAEKALGNGSKYNVIFEANRPMLSHPDKIYPGQVLRIPQDA